MASKRSHPPASDLAAKRAKEEHEDEQEEEEEHEEYVGLGTLTVQDAKRADRHLLVKVLSKKPVKQTSRNSVFNARFCDKRQDEIGFEAWGQELCDGLYEHLQVGSYYKIFSFGVKPTTEYDQRYHPNEKFKISYIDNVTQVCIAEKYEFPVYTALRYIPSLAEIPKMDLEAGKWIVNVVGTVVRQEAPFVGVSKAGNNYTKRIVTIADESNNCIDVTLFNEKADVNYTNSSILSVRNAEVNLFNSQVTLANPSIDVVADSAKYPPSSRVSAVRAWTKESSQDPSTFTNLSQRQRGGAASVGNATRTTATQLAAWMAVGKQVLDDARENGMLSNEEAKSGKAKLPQDIQSQIPFGNYSLLARIVSVRDTNSKKEKKSSVLGEEMNNNSTLIRPCCADPSHRERKPKVTSNQGNWVCKDGHTRKDCDYSFMPIISVMDETGQVDIHSFSMDGLLPEGLSATQVLLESRRIDGGRDDITAAQLDPSDHLLQNPNVVRSVNELVLSESRAFIFNVYLKIDYQQRGMQVSLSSVSQVNWGEELALLESLSAQ